MDTKDDDEKKPDLKDSTALSSTDSSFAGFVDTCEDEDEPVNQRMIQGTRIKFTNDANNPKWTNAQGVALDPQLRLIVGELKRVVNKWPVNLGPPLETKEVAPGHPWPNIKKLNAACPQTEWRTDQNGNPKGPYEGQRLLYLLDPVTLDKYTYPTTTIGGTRALSELADKISWAQKRRGPGIRPLVQLSSIWMPTRHKGRMRPHFIILPDWILPDGSSGELVHKPSPQIRSGATEAGPAMPTAAKLDASAGQSDALATTPAAKPATLSQEMKDEVPF